MKILSILILITSLNVYSQNMTLSPQEINRRFNLLNYDKRFKVKRFRDYRQKLEYEIKNITLESIHPMTKKPLITEFIWYKPKTKTRRPLMIIVPPVVGVDPLEKIFAHEYVVRNGNFNVFILKHPEEINNKRRPLSDLSRAFASGITSSRIIIDFAETQKNIIDTSRIACYGMSLGGIMSAFLIETDKRVKAAVVIVGGGNFPEILANSEQSIVKGYREARMKAERIKTPQELEKKVRDQLLFDPLFFASRRSASDVYMVIAEEDTAVPTKNQLELWEAFGRPENKRFDSNHFPTIFQNLFQHVPIREFLKEKLSMDDWVITP